MATATGRWMMVWKNFRSIAGDDNEKNYWGQDGKRVPEFATRDNYLDGRGIAITFSLRENNRLFGQ